MTNHLDYLFIGGLIVLTLLAILFSNYRKSIVQTKTVIKKVMTTPTITPPYRYNPNTGYVAPVVPTAGPTINSGGERAIPPQQTTTNNFNDTHEAGPSATLTPAPTPSPTPNCIHLLPGFVDINCT